MHFLRVSIDTGGSFLKVIVNVFVPDDDRNTKFSNSGVQKCQILAITEDVPESYENLRMMLEKLNLQGQVNFYLAFDLKSNSIFGFSSHSGKYACLWCEGTSTCESGTLRTLGSLDLHYENFVNMDCKKSKMQECKNLINPRILYRNEDPETLIEKLVPPPELHLMIGFVSHIRTQLLDLWPGFDEWLNQNNILQRGYQGRGWDGKN